MKRRVALLTFSDPIGLSEVEILAVEGNVLVVCGLDALDGTLLLDIKPVWVPT